MPTAACPSRAATRTLNSAPNNEEGQVLAEVTITKDDVNGNESYTYTAKLELEGKLGGNAGPLKGTLSGKQNRTGAITVTRDQRTGKIVRIDMTQTVESGSTSGKVEVGGDNGESGADKRGGKGSASDSSGETGIEVVTNSIVFGKETDAGTEAKRAVAEQWLDGSGNNTAPFEYLFGDRGMETRPHGQRPLRTAHVRGRAVQHDALPRGDGRAGVRLRDLARDDSGSVSRTSRRRRR
ncbi:hypothetical protein SMICM17S_00361 [Streptomyces microflavus]